MVNQYQRGYRIERKAVHVLEELGYKVVRSAGSHGIDLVAALRPSEAKELPVIRMIMVTLSRTSAKRKKDKQYLADLPTLVSKELWVWNGKTFDIETLEELDA